MQFHLPGKAQTGRLCNSTCMRLTPLTHVHAFECVTVWMCMQKKRNWHSHMHANTCCLTFLLGPCMCMGHVQAFPAAMAHTLRCCVLFLCESGRRMGEREDLGVLEYLIQ